MSKQFPDHAGLCKSCTYARLVGNERGSIFVLCEGRKIIPGLPKYPTLPVAECKGYKFKNKDEPKID